MAIEAARLSPSLVAAAFLGRRPPPSPTHLRRALPLLLPRRLLTSASASVSSGGDGSAVALPSSELRKRRSSASTTSAPGEDEKLCSLRRFLARPDIAIDAYIVPSQDAHQVPTPLPAPLMLQISDPFCLIRLTQRRNDALLVICDQKKK